MELRQLRAFVKAADFLNFSKAAEALFMTQSTLSQNIKSLEEELNTKLFYRSNHSVRLTEAGSQLIPFARMTIHDSENCVNKINDLNNLQCGSLNIGVTHSFSQIMTQTISSFIKKYPGIRINITYRTMNELMTMLTNRDLDFVLSYKSFHKFNHVKSHTLFEDKLSLIVCVDSPLAKLEKVSLSDLSDYSLILPAKGLQARNVLDYLCSINNINLNAKIEIDQVSSILQLVRLRTYVTVLSSMSINSFPDLKAIPIDCENNKMEGSFHILKDSYTKLSVKKFIHLLEESDMMIYLRNNWID